MQRGLVRPAFDRPLRRIVVIKGSGSVIDKDFLEILACPACKTSVRQEDDWLVCQKCKRRYPIRDGIPIMLLEEAQLPAKDEQR